MCDQTIDYYAWNKPFLWNHHRHCTWPEFWFKILTWLNAQTAIWANRINSDWRKLNDLEQLSQTKLQIATNEHVLLLLRLQKTSNGKDSPLENEHKSIQTYKTYQFFGCHLDLVRNTSSNMKKQHWKTILRAKGISPSSVSPNPVGFKVPTSPQRLKQKYSVSGW